MKDAKQAAKETRAALKTAYPLAKFSVRSKSFSGGSSVEVEWTDGPTESEIEARTENLKGYKNGYYNDYINTRRLHSFEAMLAAAHAAREYFGVDDVVVEQSERVRPHVTTMTQVPNTSKFSCCDNEPVCDVIHRAVNNTSLYNKDFGDTFAEAF